MHASVCASSGVQACTPACTWRACLPKLLCLEGCAGHKVKDTVRPDRRAWQRAGEEMPMRAYPGLLTKCLKISKLASRLF